MSKIPAGVSELRQAFYGHFANSQKIEQRSSYLLLFYAVECGFKSVFLKNRNFHTTEQIDDSITKFGHDLNLWKKELKIAASETPHFSLDKGGSHLEIEKAHQVWRYGVKMDPDQEKILVGWLKDCVELIKEKL